jgi:hypothetical protein
MVCIATAGRGQLAARRWNGSNSVLAETTMPNPHLPAETLDHIVDHLHDTEDALRNACLASKSWIPRTRKHLFAGVRFPTEERLQSWKETFPDPSTSPAHYAKTLYVGCPDVITAADAEAGSWIGGFSRVVHLELGRRGLWAWDASFVPFHGFSLAIKSLRMTFIVPPYSRIFNLILSFPLLEDLAVDSPAVRDPEWDAIPIAAQPPSPPVLTGSLELHQRGGMGPFARRLLSLQSGIHFRELSLAWNDDEDLLTTTAMVEACAHTLESLKIYSVYRTSIQHLRPHR